MEKTISETELFNEFIEGTITEFGRTGKPKRTFVARDLTYGFELQSLDTMIESELEDIKQSDDPTYHLEVLSEQLASGERSVKALLKHFEELKEERLLEVEEDVEATRYRVAS